MSDPNRDQDRVVKSQPHFPIENKINVMASGRSRTERENSRSTASSGSSGHGDRATPFPKFSNKLEQDLVQVFKLLADATRLKIIMGLLREGEMHVSALCDMLGQSQPAVSHHLSILREGQIIEPRRDGKHNFYSVSQNRFHEVMAYLFSAISDPVHQEVRFHSFVVKRIS